MNIEIILPKSLKFEWVKVDTKEYIENTTQRLLYIYIPRTPKAFSYWSSRIKIFQYGRWEWVEIGKYKKASEAKTAAINSFVNMAKASARSTFLKEFLIPDGPTF